MIIGKVKGTFPKRIEILKKWDIAYIIKIHQDNTFGGLVSPHYIIPSGGRAFTNINNAIKELRKEIKKTGGRLVLDKKKLDLFKERNKKKEAL